MVRLNSSPFLFLRYIVGLTLVVLSLPVPTENQSWRRVSCLYILSIPECGKNIREFRALRTVFGNNRASTRLLRRPVLFLKGPCSSGAWADSPLTRTPSGADMVTGARIWIQRANRNKNSRFRSYLKTFYRNPPRIDRAFWWYPTMPRSFPLIAAWQSCTRLKDGFPPVSWSSSRCPRTESGRQP